MKVTADEMENIITSAVYEGEYNLAIHLLETLRDDYADEYEYDVSMGTLETPVPIKGKRNE